MLKSILKGLLGRNLSARIRERLNRHPRTNRHFHAMHQDLTEMLTPMLHHQYSYRTTGADLFFAYRLLLCRAPENFDALALRERAKQFPDVADLQHAFLSSPEFRKRFFGESQRGGQRIVLVPVGNRRIAVSLDDHVIGWAIVNGTYEPETEKIISSLVKPGMTCLDLGGNVGYFASLLGELVGPTGRVIAYEPFPQVHELLQMTLKESGLTWVEARRKAAAESASTETLYTSTAHHLGGSFISREPVPDADPPLQQITISCTALDEDLAALDRLDFIKMDIEGAEMRALRGMTGLIERFRPTVLVEINAPCLARNQASPGELVEYFTSRGYVANAVTDEGTLIPLTLSTIHPDEIVNAVMVPGGR